MLSLSEINLTQKYKIQHDLTFMHYPKNVELTKAESRMVVARGRKKRGTCWSKGTSFHYKSVV